MSAKSFRATVSVFLLLPMVGRSADWVGDLLLRSESRTQILFWNSKYMLLTGSPGSAFSSEDGRTWTNVHGSEALGSNALVSRYVPIDGWLYAPSSIDLQRSTDAIHWTRVSGPPNCKLADMAKGNGILIGVADCSDREIWSSSDGDRWTSRKSPFEGGLNRIAFGNGVFVAMNAGRIASSTDGMEWTLRHTEQAATFIDGLKDLVFAKGRFVAVAWKGQVLSSIDGSIWESKAIANDRTVFKSLVFQGGRFIAQAEVSSQLYFSPDGLQWTLRETENFQVSSITYGNGRFIATDGKGNLAATDDSATSWTRTQAQVGTINAVVHTENGFLAMGSGGILVTSPDAVHWTERPADSLWDIEAAAWGAGTAVAVGKKGIIRTSTDLIHWVTRSSGTKDDLATVTFGNSVFVATSRDGVILTSPDGVAWEQTYAAPTIYNLRHAAFGNGIFLVLVSSQIKSWLTSPDGRRWTLHQEGGLHGFFQDFLVFGNSRFLMGYQMTASKRDSVWTTVDGTHLQPHQVEPKFAQLGYFAWSMTFGNGYFFALGQDGETILSSTNGEGVWMIDSSNHNDATRLAYTGGRLFKFGQHGISSAADYKPSSIARIPIRLAPEGRARRIPPEGFRLPAAWAEEGLIVEVHDAKGKRILRRPLLSFGHPFHIAPPSAEGVYYLKMERPLSSDKRKPRGL